MLVYNQEKTEILTDYDLTKGYLQNDTITKHIPEVKAVEERFHYETVKEYPNGGRDRKKVIDVAGVKAVPAHDETEEIQVYIPYTDEELDNLHKKQLRATRNTLLNAFDKWEKAVLRGRETDSEEVMQWYNELLALQENAFTEIPDKIQYYL